MLNIKLASTAMENAEVQNATQIAYANVQKTKKAGKTGKSPARRMENAASRLQDAANELETALMNLPAGAHQEDVHEALGQIMETQQLLAAAFVRLRRAA